MKRLFPRSSRGFTIIEVMIVLAIAGVVLVVVLMAVPSMQRNERNTNRKQFVEFTATLLEEYYVTQGASSYPDTPDDMCSFIMGALKERAGGATSCNPSFVGSGNCVLVDGGVYDICYRNRHVASHGYVGSTDQVNLQLGHWCVPDPNPWPADDGNPITSGNETAHNLVKRYAVWTSLEPSGFVCVDNYPHKD